MPNGHQTWQGDDLLFEASTNKISQSWSMWSSEDEWQIENIYLTNTLPMATKLGRVMTYREGLLLIKLPGHLITWSCKITWKIRKCFISTITMLTNTKLSSVVAYGERLRPIKSNDHLNKWYVRSRDRLKTLNLNAYGTHTCQGGDIRLVAPTQKVIWPFNHVLWF